MTVSADGITVKHLLEARDFICWRLELDALRPWRLAAFVRLMDDVQAYNAEIDFAATRALLTSRRYFAPS